MSRFIQGDCVRIMAGFPDNAVDFILTNPPYLVGFKIVLAARLPAIKPMNGYSRPAMRCTAC